MSTFGWLYALWLSENITLWTQLILCPFSAVRYTSDVHSRHFINPLYLHPISSTLACNMYSDWHCPETTRLPLRIIDCLKLLTRGQVFSGLATLYTGCSTKFGLCILLTTTHTLIPPDRMIWTHSWGYRATSPNTQTCHDKIGNFMSVNNKTCSLFQATCNATLTLGLSSALHASPYITHEEWRTKINLEVCALPFVPFHTCEIDPRDEMPSHNGWRRLRSTFSLLSPFSSKSHLGQICLFIDCPHVQLMWGFHSLFGLGTLF